MTDLTSAKHDYMVKKLVTSFAAPVNEGTDSGDFLAASDNHLLANLPADALILDAFIFVKTASDAATSAVATLGTTSGGTQILSAADLTSTGKEGTFTGESDTGTGVPLYLGLTYTGAATEVGEYVVVVEYLEYTKDFGEYTQISR